MFKFSFPLAALSLAALPLPVHAQNFGDVVGLTHLTPQVQRQTMDGAKCAATRCVPTPAFERRLTPFAGGTAYDGRVAGVWVSNGTLIACVDPYTCKYICPPQKMPIPPYGTQRPICTGLAFVESGAVPSPAVGAPGWLFASYSNGAIGRISVTTGSSGCSLKAVYCNTLMIKGYVPSGVATDDVGRLLFVGSSNFSAANPASIINVYGPIDGPNSAGPWCRPICRFSVHPCPTGRMLGHITGLAFDPCKKILFITDGMMTLYGTYTHKSASGLIICRFTPIACCPNTGTELYTGLCYMAKPSTSLGRSCTVAACQICPNMVAGKIGDPVLGNPNFTITLRNAPSNTTLAALAIGFGPCWLPGVNIGFCQTVKVNFGPPPPLLVFMPGLVGPGTCTGSRNLRLPVPLNTAICGLKLSSQWLVVCKGLVLPGHGVTNCLTLEVSGT